MLSGAFSASAVGQERARSSAQRYSAEQEISRVNAEVRRTIAEVKETLESLLELQEQDAERLARQLESRAPLLEKGYISRLELEESELALARARARVEDTRQQISLADMTLAEVVARALLLRLPPLPSGGYSENTELVRYNGGARWSLADAAKIERFFADRFGHFLPVSARGQTTLHERMNFDHRNALDVALHPDSPEGRELMGYLRKAGIPFVAFRDRAAGVSTGAHIHIGRPSLRLASP